MFVSEGYIISIIGTHQARIRCLLDEITKNKLKKIHKFKNCCILEIKIEDGQNNSSIKLVHEGDGDENSKKHYGITRSNKEFRDITFTYKCPINGKKYKFYLIRHGQGVHNIYKLPLKPFQSVKNKDTKLTNEGEKQAEHSGIKLNYILTINSIKKIDNIYISDLYRTYQTLNIVLEKVDVYKPIKYKLLPCNHELLYIPGKKCDGKQKRLMYKTALAEENKPEKLLGDLGDINNGLDKTLYRSFYNGDRRYKVHSRKCRDNNMITLAINDINDINIQNGGFNKIILKYNKRLSNKRLSNKRLSNKILKRISKMKSKRKSKRKSKKKTNRKTRNSRRKPMNKIR